MTRAELREYIKHNYGGVSNGTPLITNTERALAGIIPSAGKRANPSPQVVAGHLDTLAFEASRLARSIRINTGCPPRIQRRRSTDHSRRFTDHTPTL